uniref:Uncharacterized protein n=1 Tax=Timema cristinae TaxID=61476 RepID=A0A7R9D127_TIMCR|nr:unnamed protein product [Timema cristinae]
MMNGLNMVIMKGGNHGREEEMTGPKEMRDLRWKEELLEDSGAIGVWIRQGGTTGTANPLHLEAPVILEGTRDLIEREILKGTTEKEEVMDIEAEKTHLDLQGMVGVQEVRPANEAETEQIPETEETHEIANLSLTVEAEDRMTTVQTVQIFMIIGGMGKAGFKGSIPPFAWRESEKPSSPDRGSNPNFAFIGSLIYCENDAIDHKIKEDIIKCGLMPKDIRLIRRKDTGASRGFAFVEFNTKQEASRWIETKQGELILHDQYRAVIHYSVSVKCTNDWVCTKCGGHNFRRRDTCYKCYTSRLESRDEAEERDEVSRLPTHTILLRNLDVLTTEETVLLTMKSLPALTMTHVKSIRIGRDPLTNTSLGLCYIEMKSLIHATHFHHVLTAHRLEIDGKKVLVSYCKVNDGSSQVSGANAGYASVTNYTAKDIPRLAEYSASLYATTTEEHATYLQYYTDYYQNQVAQGGTISLPTQTQTDTVNAAAAVAQSAIQQAMAIRMKKQAPAASTSELASAYYTGNATVATSPAVIAASAVPASSSSTTPSHSTTLTQYPTPDVSTYQYDKTSGYYYDPQTGLYYDASSQYYYNSQTQQFMYWDADKHTYMPAPVSAAITAAPTTTPSTDTAVTAAPATPSTPTPPQPEVTPEDGEKDEKKGKEKEKQDKVKVAKKVVKEMERWAKMLNQKKENAQQNLTMQAANLLQSKSKGTADIGYAVLERKESQPIILNNSVSTLPFTMQDSEQSVLASRINLDSASRRNVPSLVPKYGGGSDSEDNEDSQSDESQFTNWVKMACLLCKRQFPTKDALIRFLFYEVPLCVSLSLLIRFTRIKPRSGD